MKTNSKIRSLIPITRWNEKHPYPSERQLRWLAFTGKDGFAKCLVKVGKRILIDEELYFAWVEKQAANIAGEKPTKVRKN